MVDHLGIGYSFALPVRYIDTELVGQAKKLLCLFFYEIRQLERECYAARIERQLARIRYGKAKTNVKAKKARKSAPKGRKRGRSRKNRRVQR